VSVSVSTDGKTGAKYDALIDTGYSGFLSLPGMAASLLGLKPHTTTHYNLANGKQSDPVPLAHGYACVEGDPYVKGLIAFSENTLPAVGVDFLTRCGHILLMSSKGIVLLNEKEIEEALTKMQQEFAKLAAAKSQTASKTAS
jgi:predicted aspartyl protease